MTDDQFKKAQELKEQIEALYEESGYLYSGLPKHDDQYDKFVVSGLCSDGWYGSEWAPMMVSPSYWAKIPKPPKDGDPE